MPEISCRQAAEGVFTRLPDKKQGDRCTVSLPLYDDLY